MVIDPSIGIIVATKIQTILRMLKFYKNGTYKKQNLKKKKLIYSFSTIFPFIHPSCLSFLLEFYLFHLYFLFLFQIEYFELERLCLIQFHFVATAFFFIHVEFIYFNYSATIGIIFIYCFIGLCRVMINVA